MTTRIHKLTSLIALIAIAALVLFSVAHSALAKEWDNGGAGNDWATNGNWDGDGTPPSGAEQARINGGFSVDVTSAVPAFTGDFVPGDSAGVVNLSINGGAAVLSPGGNTFAANAGGSTLNLSITNGGAFNQTGGSFIVGNGIVNLSIDGTSSFTSPGEVKHDNSTTRLFINMLSGSTFQSQSLYLRQSQANSVSDLSGAGTVTLTNNSVDAFRNNGRVEANGGVLSINYDYTRMGPNQAGFSETMTDGQIAGYYAVNGGTLTMPDVILGNSSVRSWGNRHDSGVDNIPWIGSLQFTGAGMTGTIDVEILALDLVSVQPGLINPVNVWQMSSSDAANVTGLTAHYDDFLAANLGVTEGDLKMLFNDGSGWVDITSSINTGTDLVKGTPTSFNGQFAVAESFQNPSNGTPEPSTFILAVLSLLGLTLTRRRNRK